MNLVIDVNRHNVAEDQGLSSILKSQEALQTIQTSYQLKPLTTMSKTATIYHHDKL